jgi:hypothetical protein
MKKINMIEILQYLLNKKSTPKFLKHNLIIMLAVTAEPELASSVKRVKGKYERPKNVSELVTYFASILLDLTEDTLFAGIAALITAAQAQNSKLNTAEIATKTSKGKIGERDVQKRKMNVLMDEILAKVQKAADDDPLNAVSIFQRNGISIEGRTPHVRPEVGATNGTASGTLDVSHSTLSKKGSYLWMTSIDGTNWVYGIHSHKSTGLIIGLTPKVEYFIRSQTSSADGYSAWSQIIRIICH